MNCVKVRDAEGKFYYTPESNQNLVDGNWVDDEVMNFVFWREVSLYVAAKERTSPHVIWLKSWISVLPTRLMNNSGD